MKKTLKTHHRLKQTPYENDHRKNNIHHHPSSLLTLKKHPVNETLSVCLPNKNLFFYLSKKNQFSLNK